MRQKTKKTSTAKPAVTNNLNSRIAQTVCSGLAIIGLIYSFTILVKLIPSDPYVLGACFKNETGTIAKIDFFTGQGYLKRTNYTYIDFMDGINSKDRYSEDYFKEDFKSVYSEKIDCQIYDKRMLKIELDKLETKVIGLEKEVEELQKRHR